jgi:hypothetical protein
MTQIIVRVRSNRPNAVRTKLRSDGKPAIGGLRPIGVTAEPTSITLDELGLSWDLSPYMLVEGIPPPLRLWNSYARDETMEEEDSEPVQVPLTPEPLSEKAGVSETLAWTRNKIEYERKALASVLDEILV